MEEKERKAGRLEYGRAEIALRRPWYVWVGAGMAAVWLAALGLWSLYGITRVLMDRARGADWGLAFAALSLLGLITAMALVLEWRAIFHRSANASALVGLLLALPALFAAVAEGYAFLHHEKTMVIVGLGVLTSSLGFCVWSHFQWARVIADWLTRSLEVVPTRDAR